MFVTLFKKKKKTFWLQRHCPLGASEFLKTTLGSMHTFDMQITDVNPALSGPCIPGGNILLS